MVRSTSPAPSPPPGGEGITQERGHQEARVVGSRLALPSRRDAQSRRGAPSVSAAALTAAVSVGSGIDLPRADVRTGSAELLRRRFCVSAFRHVAGSAPFPSQGSSPLPGCVPAPQPPTFGLTPTWLRCPFFEVSLGPCRPAMARSRAKRAPSRPHFSCRMLSRLPCLVCPPEQSLRSVVTETTSVLLWSSPARSTSPLLDKHWHGE